MENVKKIASFTVDHDYITEGIYVSRIDGDITTYDMRTRIPNSDDYMDNLTIHSFEHMFATYVRSSKIGEDVIYFGPMGCQTGFYLLVRNAENSKVLDTVFDVLEKIISHEGEIFGKARVECGNYKNLDVESARTEARRYLSCLLAKENDFLYRGSENEG
ncbi:MAG: S-ribosylhomocysteine lyase [Clostridia bacterium]|nr:S-ribosylhomocysteine lyase [Clostridia bacterium]